MGKNKTKPPGRATRGVGNVLSTAVRNLILLLLVALAVCIGLLYTHQQQQARESAHDQANALAHGLALELAGQFKQDRQRLAELGKTARVRAGIGAGLIQASPDLDDTRLTVVPNGANEQGRLSFTERDLLRQRRQTQQDTHSTRGGKHPSLLLAHGIPGGTLILERDLTPWLINAQRRLPDHSGLTLKDTALTLAHHGDVRGSGLSATAKGGPLTVNVAIAPQPVNWARLLAAAALIAALLTIGIATVVRVIARTLGTHTGRPEPAVQPVIHNRASLDTVRDAPMAPAPEPAPTPEPTGTALPESLFRADDIGGVVGGSLNQDAVRLLGQAIGTVAGEAGQHTVFTAGDSLPSDAGLMDALIKGLSAAGRHVIDLGTQPAPLLYFATETLESRTGVYLNASDFEASQSEAHLRILIDGVMLQGEQLYELRQRILENRLDQAEGLVQVRDIRTHYLRTLSDDIILARPMSIAIDCDNEATGIVAATLFEELGCRVVPLYSAPDDAANRKTLIDAVRNQKLDLGLVFGGDGDRLGLVTADGEIIRADQLLMLFAQDLLQRNPGTDVVFDVKCSPALPALIRQHGGRPVQCQDDRSLIRARMEEIGAPLAGGMNGHIFFADRWFGFDDGLYAGARLLEILSQERGDSTAVFAGLRTGATTPAPSVPADDERKFEV